MNNISPLEMQLTALCNDTDTPEKCLKAMGEVKELIYGAEMEEARDLETVVDILFARGNTIILERRGEA